jgi:hypothetical protein
MASLEIAYYTRDQNLNIPGVEISAETISTLSGSNQRSAVTPSNAAYVTVSANGGAARYSYTSATSTAAATKSMGAERLPRAAVALHARRGARASVIWPRRHGKDDVALHFTACAAHERVGVYWHLLPQQNQARKAIWDAVDPHTGKRRIDNAFPPALRETTREQDMMIRFKSGSTWQVIGSDNYDALVGTPPIGVVFSEWALSSPQAWSLIRPILAENGGWAMFITTPRGRNHAHRMHDMALASDDWFAERLIATETGVFSEETLAQELAELKAERGDEDGEAIYQQEYMTSFSAGLPGAYYAKIIDRLENDNRITAVPYNPQRRSTPPGTWAATTRRRFGSSSGTARAGRSSTIWRIPASALIGMSGAEGQALQLRRASSAARRGERAASQHDRLDRRHGWRNGASGRADCPAHQERHQRHQRGSADPAALLVRQGKDGEGR